MGVNNNSQTTTITNAITYNNVNVKNAIFFDDVKNKGIPLSKETYQKFRIMYASTLGEILSNFLKTKRLNSNSKNIEHFCSQVHFISPYTNQPVIKVYTLKKELTINFTENFFKHLLHSFLLNNIYKNHYFQYDDIKQKLDHDEIEERRLIPVMYYIFINKINSQQNNQNYCQIILKALENSINFDIIKANITEKEYFEKLGYNNNI